MFEDAYNYMKSGQLMRQVVNKINEVDFNNLAERCKARLCQRRDFHAPPSFMWRFTSL